MSHGTQIWVIAHETHVSHVKRYTRRVTHMWDMSKLYTRGVTHVSPLHVWFGDQQTSTVSKKNSYKSALQSFCWAFVVAKWRLSDVVWHSVAQSWSTASFTDKSCFQVLQHSLQIFKYSNMVFANKSHDKACMECMRWLQLVASINL